VEEAVSRIYDAGLVVSVFVLTAAEVHGPALVTYGIMVAAAVFCLNCLFRIMENVYEEENTDA
jgi:hypothetical protein